MCKSLFRFLKLSIQCPFITEIAQWLFPPWNSFRAVPFLLIKVVYMLEGWHWWRWEGDNSNGASCQNVSLAHPGWSHFRTGAVQSNLIGLRTDTARCSPDKQRKLSAHQALGSLCFVFFFKGFIHTIWEGNSKHIAFPFSKWQIFCMKAAFSPPSNFFFFLVLLAISASGSDVPLLLWVMFQITQF